MPSSIGYVKAGQLRPLAVTTATRSEALPELPSVGDAVAGYEASTWYGVGAEEHSRRGHRQAQQGDQCRPCRSQAEDEANRTRGHDAYRLIRRLRHVHLRRNAEVGQGGEVLGRQGGLISRIPAASVFLYSSRSIVQHPCGSP